MTKIWRNIKIYILSGQQYRTIYMKTYLRFYAHLAKYLSERKMFRTELAEKN